MRFVLQAHDSGTLHDVVAHADQPLVASASSDGTVRLWDLQKMVCCDYFFFIILSQSQTSIYSSPGMDQTALDFTSDGNRLVVGSGIGEITVINTENMSIVAKRREKNTPITVVKVSPNGALCAVGHMDGSINMHSLESTDLARSTFCKLASNVGQPRQIDFSDNSQFMAVGTSDSSVHIFRSANGNLVTSVTDTSKLVFATWTRTGGELMAGVWPQVWRSDQIRCAQLANSANVVAVGNQSGQVQLFQFPCRRVDEKQVRRTSGQV